MSVGTLVLGLLNGLTIGLLAVGLVLVYKANRFLNLAHAQLGALSALLLAKGVLDWQLNWWLAFVLAVLMGSITGLVVDLVLIRPLRRRQASGTQLLLMSVGISQMLLGLTYVPQLAPDTQDGADYPMPFEWHDRIGGVVLNGMWLMTAVLVPALVIALGVFLRRSVLGKQIRAAASNPDAARLCGISVTAVSAITWSLAGGLAAVSAVLAAPTQPSFNAAALGPYLLVATLGAAAIGAFMSLSSAMAGGLLVGVVAQVTLAEAPDASDSRLAVFALVMAIVLIRGKAIGRAFSLAGGVNRERPALRVPPAMRNSRLVRHQRLATYAGGLLLLAIWPRLPYFDRPGNQFQLTLLLVFAVVGVALTMVVGWSGQVSLGHFAIVGGAAFLAARWSSDGMSLPALCVCVGLIGAAVMVVIGLPALRVPGLALAVTTLGFAVIANEWLFNQTWFGAPDGLDVAPIRIGEGVGTPTAPLSVYYVGLVVLALVIASASALRRSSPGRLIVAVRDNERASASFGVNPAVVKLGVLAVSGFFAAVGGVVWADAWQVAQLTPTQFTAGASLALVAIPVIGGLGSVSGAVVACVMVEGGAIFIGPHVQGLFGSVGNNLGFTLALAGLGQALTLWQLPDGLAGAMQKAWQRFLERRAVKVEQGRPQEVHFPLQVSGVQVQFGGVVALGGVDVTVRPGEIVGLIGTNGAGKSTLINVVSGLITPQKGSITLFGEEVVDLPPEMRPAFGLARSFQDAGLFAGLTVVETIQVALARRHRVGVLAAMAAAPWVRDSERRTRREALELVDRFGLGTWADSRIAELSTGTRRICDLVAQVASRPKLLLLDEPTAGVAQREAEAFGPLLRAIRDELECAILIVEHDMPLLMGLCDRVYAMEAGHVIAEGSPDEVRSDEAVVASYLGTNEHAVARSGARARTPMGTGSGSTAPSRRTS